MSIATGLWLTHHGLKKPKEELADLREWLEYLKLRTRPSTTDLKDKNISFILSESRACHLGGHICYVHRMATLGHEAAHII
jgi:hypothetical protein